jgi:hypothetical protein
VGSTEGASAAQNVQFVDGDSQWTYNIDTDADATTKLSGFSDADLGSFLSRPLRFNLINGHQMMLIFSINLIHGQISLVTQMC